MVVKVLDRHIEITPEVAGGKPRIVGRRITVQNIAIWHERLGMSAHEICAEYDLSLADVHAALAFYFDHQHEVDAQIENDIVFAESLRQVSPSLLRERLALNRVEYL